MVQNVIKSLYNFLIYKTLTLTLTFVRNFEPVKGHLLKEEKKQNIKFINDDDKKNQLLKKITTTIEKKIYLTELKINYDEVPM